MKLLEAVGVTKWFGGLCALHEVDMTIDRGEIRGLIGPNGSGKTTLFNVISGVYPMNAGRVLFQGRPINRLLAHAVTRRGLARTFQNIKLFTNMTVLENVMVGRHCRTRTEVVGALLRTAAARAEERAIREECVAILEHVGLAHRAGDLARNLPYGQQRILEIARALATGPEFIMLDEPAAGLTMNEADAVVDLVGRLRDQGYTVLVIEHNMRVIMRVCDRITVLEGGRKIAEGRPAEIQQDPAVIRAYLGVARPLQRQHRRSDRGVLEGV